MFPPTLFAFVAALSSLVDVHGAVVQRDGTFTYLTPQPTSPNQGAGSTTATSGSQTYSATSTLPTTSPPSTTPYSSSSTVPPYQATGTTTTSSSQTYSTTSTRPTTSPPSTTPYSSSSTVPPYQATGTTSTTSSSAPSSQSTYSSASSSGTSTTPYPSSATSSRPTVVPWTTPSQVPSWIPTSSVPVISTTPSQFPSWIPTSSAPVISTTSLPVPSAGTANCNGVQQWQAAFAYNAGDRVIFNNQLFTATQWTYDNAPPAHADQWTAGGTCSQPILNKVNCNGVAAWQKSAVYNAGNKVTFNGHLWSAVQWTTSNSPGDASGSWQDLGACA